MARARLDRPQLLLLFGVERTGQAHEKRAGEPDDGVERCPQLVAHAREKIVLREAGALELLVLLAQRRLEMFALGAVADRALDERLALCPDGAETDLDRELGAVLAQAVE